MLRRLQIIGVLFSAIFLCGVLALLLAERSWRTPEPTTPRDYFLYGSTGTELMPLPVFRVLPYLFPQHFQPGGAKAGDWVDQFGFVRGRSEVNEGLPVGMNQSSYRPKSGAPSPVQFVGFNCAACHTARIIRSEGDSGVVVYGMGNPAIDLVAFGEAVKSSLLDEEHLSTHLIDSVYRKNYGRGLSATEKLLITLYLQQVRAGIRSEVAMRDLPFGGDQLRDPLLMPSGPGRNQPMKETVRFLVHRTPNPDGGSSKIPGLYRQDRRIWAQYDGSVRDPFARNSLAALGVGASLQNLRIPLMLHTLQQAYTYTKALEGPKFVAVFPDARIDEARAARGKIVYARFCSSCHGAPGDQPGQWITGPRQGTIIANEEVGTDNARTTFRYYDRMADYIYDYFPKDHPLKPKREDLRASRGYVAGAIEATFTRAPYLHNGSVATLAELINLKPRRAVLYRGSNVYDPVDVGLSSPDTVSVRDYFRYDTRVAGNGNRGHDYPWAYGAPSRDETALRDLLEYLKTI